jgi:hypothetical protein
VGDVKIRYYVTRKAWPGSRARWGYWSPCLIRDGKPTKMALHGFKMVDCGEDGPAAWAIAEHWNRQWDAVRKGGTAAPADAPRYPAGSVGDGYMRAMAMRAAERKKNGVVWTREHESRDDWPRAWKWLELVFGDVDPKTVQPEHFLSIDTKSGTVQGLLPMIETAVSVTERHRVVKVWRALWKRMVTFGYCSDERGVRNDPSMAVANSAPQPRQDTWQHKEVLARVQMGWRMGKKGLAACLAVAWDSMLSPIDARKLTLGQLTRDENGLLYFELGRAKTGRAAVATLSQWSLALLTAYVKDLKAQGVGLLPAAPIFRTPGAKPGPKGGRRWAPKAYSKNQLGKHFRLVRAAIDPKDRRQVADLRRSGAVEGYAGGATPSDTSNKMANTLMASTRLQKTYTPVNVPSVLRFDQARAGSRRARRANEPGAKS